jgi:hypothetical protein
MDDKRAMLEFMGQFHSEMKAIDTHIEAAGSNAKFGGRSEDIKDSMKALMAVPISSLQAPTETVSVGATNPPQILQNNPQQVSQVVTPVVKIDNNQLEFNFNETPVSILKEMRDRMDSMERSMKRIIAYIDSIQTQPDERGDCNNVGSTELGRGSVCCLCGGTPKTKKTNDNIYVTKCVSCNNSEEGSTRKASRDLWNSKNLTV